MKFLFVIFFLCSCQQVRGINEFESKKEGTHPGIKAYNSDLLEKIQNKKEKPTAYVCKQGVCKLPTTEKSVLKKQIREINSLKAP